ncbi:MAG: hypothetical protein MI867_14510 [Pseudomonadales bacterium]|nr:hypothetical protein [Pseudomonadales bacterium]
MPLCLLLAACGGGGGGSSSSDRGSSDDGSDGGSSDSPLTGYFIDAPVAGLSYQTRTPSGSTLEGVTGANGEYPYFENTVTRFYLGELTLGSGLGQPVTTPFSFVSESTHEDFPQNMAQMLLSVDSNQNGDDGIDISSDVRTGFNNVRAGLLEMLDQASDDFESDFQGFVDSSLPDYSDDVVTASAALAHLQNSMSDIDYQVTLNGTSWRTEYQPLFLQYWNSETETWVTQQSCSNQDYQLYRIDEYTSSTVTTTQWDAFAWLPNCARLGEEIVQSARSLDEETLCGYRLADDTSADISQCHFAALNNKATFTNGDGQTITLHLSHIQNSGEVYQTFYKEYSQGEINYRQKWRAVTTLSTEQ